MRFSAPLLTVVGTVAGAAAAVVTYQAAAAPASTVTRTVADSTPAAPAAPSWLPCEAGWKVHGDACVRVKHRVVVVHDLPAPAAAPVVSTPVTPPPPAVAQDGRGTAQAHHASHSESGDTSETTDGPSGDNAGEPQDAPGTEDVGGDD